VGVLDVGEEAGEGRAAEVVHRDHERRADGVDHAGHLVLGHRVGAVDRDHHDVDLAEFAQVLAGELVVEVAEVGDAQVGRLEDEDRVAVALEPERPCTLVGMLRTRRSSSVTSCWASPPAGLQPRSACFTAGSTKSV
jgi:hypothetical protein